MIDHVSVIQTLGNQIGSLTAEKAMLDNAVQRLLEELERTQTELQEANAELEAFREEGKDVAPEA